MSNIKNLNEKLCKNDEFWNYKLLYDFPNFTKSKDIKSVSNKELYFKLAYESFKLYIGEKFITNNVKKVNIYQRNIFYITFHEKLYKISFNDINKSEFISNNVVDINNGLYLKSNGECYSYWDNTTKIIDENVTKLLKYKYYIKNGEINNEEYVFDIKNVNKLDLYQRNIIYSTNDGELGIYIEHSFIKNLIDFEKYSATERIIIENGVKEFIVIGSEIYVVNFEGKLFVLSLSNVGNLNINGVLDGPFKEIINIDYAIDNNNNLVNDYISEDKQKIIKKNVHNIDIGYGLMALVVYESTF